MRYRERERERENVKTHEYVYWYGHFVYGLESASGLLSKFIEPFFGMRSFSYVIVTVSMSFLN